MKELLEAKVYGEFEHEPITRHFMRLGKKIVALAKDRVHFMDFPSGKTIWTAHEEALDVILRCRNEHLVFNNYNGTRGEPVKGPDGKKYAGFNHIHVFGDYRENVLSPEASQRISSGAIFAAVMGGRLLIGLPDARTIITSENHEYAKMPTSVRVDSFFKPFKIDGKSAVFDSDNETEFYELRKGGHGHQKKRILRHFPVQVDPEIIYVEKRRLLQAKDRRTFFDLNTGKPMCEDPLPFETFDSVFSYQGALLARDTELGPTKTYTKYVNIETGERGLTLQGSTGFKIITVQGMPLYSERSRTREFKSLPTCEVALRFPELVEPFFREYHGRTFAFSAFGKNIYTVEKTL